MIENTLPDGASEAKPRGASPTEACELYRWFSADDELLYVGMSMSSAARASQHKRQAPWWPFAVTMTIERFPTRAKARQAEKDAIANELPAFNIADAYPTWPICIPTDIWGRESFRTLSRDAQVAYFMVITATSESGGLVEMRHWGDDFTELHEAGWIVRRTFGDRTFVFPVPERLRSSAPGGGRRYAAYTGKVTEANSRYAAASEAT